MNPILLAADGRWVAVDGKGSFSDADGHAADAVRCTRSRTSCEPQSARSVIGRLERRG